MSTQFGKYTLLRKLGDGGMAEVFLAQIQGPEGFTKLVALKRILPHLSQDETFTKSFINEARLGGYLNHHNIVQTLDFGRLGKFYYLAMEYVRGVTLADVLSAQKAQGRPMPPDMALQIALQIAEGLGYAHTAEDADGRPLRMVHRDLKPSNILINAHGVCKIADFGVARAESNVQKTVLAGEVKGTVYYMSPEQALGRRDIDGRSDLYSLGSILFELLTNERLYPQESYLACLRMVQDGQNAEQLPKVLGLEQGLHLYQLLSRMLAYDPNDRHPDAFHLARDIREVLNQFNLEWELSDYLKRLLPNSPLVVRGTTNSIQVGSPPARHALHAPPTTPPPNTPSLNPAGPSAPVRTPPPKTPHPRTPPPQAATSGQTLPPRAGRKKKAWWRRPEVWIAFWVGIIAVGAVGFRLATGGGTPVVIRSVPPGATLRDVQGNVLGTAPARIRVPRTGMDIEAVLEGYETAAAHLTGSRRQRDVLVRLSPVRGSVRIQVNPEDATVALDGKALKGKPPYVVSDLAAGKHAVSVSRSGFVDLEKTFEIVSSTPVELALELERKAKPSGATAAGKQQSSQSTAKPGEPVAARATQGSKPAAGTAAKPVARAAGTSKEGTASARPSATTSTASRTRENATSSTAKATTTGTTAQQESGFLTLNAYPYAYVEIDGVRIKTTPLIRHKLAPGPHKVTLTTEDGRVKSLDIQIEPGRTFKEIVRFDASP